MIDNLNLIKPFLEFKEEGDFYRLHIFKRKKDQTTDKANHQSVRTIKSYSIYDINYLESKYDEIKTLCEIFKARAYISLQRLNDRDVALLMLKELANRLYSNQQKMERLYDSVIGDMKSKDKRWIVDIDKEALEYKALIINEINKIKPLDWNKILFEVPTLNGIHLITKPFRVDSFNKFTDKLKIKIDINKANPTILYIGDSLTNNHG